MARAAPWLFPDVSEGMTDAPQMRPRAKFGGWLYSDIEGRLPGNLAQGMEQYRNDTHAKFCMVILLGFKTS